jgi:hypothetical protein
MKKTTREGFDTPAGVLTLNLAVGVSSLSRGTVDLNGMIQRWEDW